MYSNGISSKRVSWTGVVAIFGEVSLESTTVVGFGGFLVFSAGFGWTLGYGGWI